MALGLLVAGACVVGYLIFENYLRVAITILLLAIMMTYLLRPVVEWAVRISKNRHTHLVRTGAVLAIYLALGGLAYVFGAMITHTLTGEMNALQTTWTNAQQHIPVQAAHMRAWYEQHIPIGMRTQIEASLKQELDKMPAKYSPRLLAWLLGWAKSAGKFLGLIIELIFVPLIAFYLLTDSSRVREQALFFVPQRHRSQLLEYAGGMGSILRQYVHGQVILCAIAWAVVTLATLLMGIPGALLLGLIAGLARAIPVIGPVIGGIPLLTAVLVNPQWSGAFWIVLIAFTALHLFESKFLMPRILGDSLGVHPVLIIISLIIGYELLGLLGMFLAPPAVAAIRFVLAMRRGEGPFAARAEQTSLPGI